jgi:hypothetical protein
LESVYKDDLIKTYQKYVFVVVIVGWGPAINLNKQTHISFFSCVIVFSVDKSLTSLAQLKQRITEEVAVTSPEMVLQAVYSTRKRAIKLVVRTGEAFEERKARGGIKL